MRAAIVANIPPIVLQPNKLLQPHDLTIAPEKSQLRHIAYCRRTRSRLRPRKKSCLACIKAKTRCDLVFPSCSRCAARKLSCEYEAPSPLQDPELQASVSRQTQLQDNAIPSSDDLTNSSTALVSTTSTLSNPNLRLASNDHTVSSHSHESSADDWDLTWALELAGDAAHSSSQMGETNTTQRPQSSPRFSHYRASRFTDISDAFMGDPISMITTTPPKAFAPLHNKHTLNESYVLCTLRSYPHMMVPGKILPPFIHRSQLANESQDERVTRKFLPRPLGACSAIMEWYAVRNPSTVRDIWNCIRLEQERLSSEVCIAMEIISL